MLPGIPTDKDPRLLRGGDADAHREFQALAAKRGAVPSSVLDEAVEIIPANPVWATSYAEEVLRIRGSLPQDVPIEIEHIGSTSVPGLDGKPVIDLMFGLSHLPKIGALVDALERAGYESLNQAGVPGRWAMRRRGTFPGFNVSVMAVHGRWRQNIAFREVLRTTPEVARRYAATKWLAFRGGAETLFAYSEAKRRAVEEVAAMAGDIVGSTDIELLVPGLSLLPGYVAALETGWSADTVRNVAEEELNAINADPAPINDHSESAAEHDRARIRVRNARRIAIPG